MGRAGKTLTVVLVIGLVGGGLWIWLRPAPVAPGVMFVGDSVTFLSLDQLNQQVGSKRPLYLARSGYRSTELLPLFAAAVRVRERAHQRLRQVALLVGYDDVLKDDVETKALGRVMALAGRFDCAIWLTLPPVPLRDDRTNRWNHRVKSAARAYRHVHVLDDWRNAVMAAAPGALVVRTDGVHPNRAGARRLASIFTQAIHHLC